jgi:hypothetical protein
MQTINEGKDLSKDVGYGIETKKITLLMAHISAKPLKSV